MIKFKGDGKLGTYRRERDKHGQRFVLLIAFTVLCFLTGSAIAIIFGGNAIQGGVQGGRYFLKDDGNTIETSAFVFYVSKYSIQGFLVGTVGLMIYGIFLKLLRRRQLNADDKPSTSTKDS